MLTKPAANDGPAPFASRQYNKARVRAWRAVLEHTPVLGDKSAWHQDGTPCCAIGHLLHAEGFSFATADNWYHRYTSAEVPQAVVTRLYQTNDSAAPDARQAAVLALLDQLELEAPE